MTTEAEKHLTEALDKLAAQIAASRSKVVGMQVNVQGGPGGGNVVGMKVHAVGGPGSGNVTGLHVEAHGGGPDPAADIIKELRDAATAVRQGKAAQPWLKSLLGRASALKDRVVDVAMVAGVEHAIKAVFG
jgi:hypothetical protein